MHDIVSFSVVCKLNLVISKINQLLIFPGALLTCIANSATESVCACVSVHISL